MDKWQSDLNAEETKVMILNAVRTIVEQDPFSADNVKELIYESAVKALEIPMVFENAFVAGWGEKSDKEQAVAFPAQSARVVLDFISKSAGHFAKIKPYNRGAIVRKSYKQAFSAQ